MSDDHLSYDDLKPLVASVTPDASGVTVLFRCPATGTEVTAVSAWAQATGLQTGVKQAKRNLFSSLRSKIAQEVRQEAGYSTIGSLAGNAAADLVQSSQSTSSSGQVNHSEKDTEKAVEAAFATVASQFTWDAGASRWVAAAAAQVSASPFTDAVNANPLTEAYDIDVMQRLLAALVAADATAGDAERAEFAELAPGADLAALSARLAPGAVDFEETKQGPTRETFLLLGWAVALTDQSLADAESALLATAATGLGIAEPRLGELKALAQHHLVEEAIVHLAATGTAPDQIRTQAEAFGAAIGLGADEAARAVIRWQKAQG